MTDVSADALFNIVLVGTPSPNFAMRRRDVLSAGLGALPAPIVYLHDVGFPQVDEPQ